METKEKAFFTYKKIIIGAVVALVILGVLRYYYTPNQTNKKPLRNLLMTDEAAMAEELTVRSEVTKAERERV